MPLRTSATRVLPMQPCAVQRMETSNRRRCCCLNFEDECRAATGCGAHTAGAMTFSQGVALKCWMDRCCRGEHAAPEAHYVLLDSKSEKSSAVAGGPASRCCNADMPVDANCDCLSTLACVRFPRNSRRAVFRHATAFQRHRIRHYNHHSQPALRNLQ